MTAETEPHPMVNEEMVEIVANAINQVQCFSRINVVAGLPIEICRYGKEGEPEIVVIDRFAGNSIHAYPVDTCRR